MKGNVMTKLDTLLECEGFTSLEELFEDYEYGNRMGVPAICTNIDCDYTADMEPDQAKGWCENCETNTLASAYILAGII